MSLLVGVKRLLRFINVLLKLNKIRLGLLFTDKKRNHKGTIASIIYGLYLGVYWWVKVTDLRESYGN